MSNNNEVNGNIKNQKISKLVWLLDECISLPGGYRIGLDGILGLVPGVGDIATSGISSFLIYKAYKQNVPKLIMFKMLINIILDTVLGSVPFVGDLFDFAWRSNTKNAYLLEEYRNDPAQVYKRSAAATGLFSLIIIFIVAFCMISVYLLIKLISHLF